MRENQYKNSASWVQNNYFVEYLSVATHRWCNYKLLRYTLPIRFYTYF